MKCIALTIFIAAFAIAPAFTFQSPAQASNAKVKRFVECTTAIWDSPRAEKDAAWRRAQVQKCEADLTESIVAPIRPAADMIRNHEIAKGMTKAQVKMSWGEPCNLCYGTRSNSWGDTWVYNDLGPNYPGGTYVFFNSQGEVTGWSGP